MANIKPFRGLRYNPDKISFISRVITPPYDVIDADGECILLERDPHNFVRLDRGKTPPAGRSEDEYRSVADLLRQWQEEKILIRDEKPALYVLEQSFTMLERSYVRRGFFSALMLEDPGRGSVFPHEKTMDAPKTDRTRLMDACAATLSQPIMMHCDPGGRINSIIRDLCRKRDFLYSFQDERRIGHTVWRVEEPDSVESISALLKDQPVVIADGHHRYESALAFSRSHRPQDSPPGSQPEDYMPAFLVSIEDEGLLSLPAHRGVKSSGEFNLQAFRRALEGHFNTSELKVKDGDFAYGEYETAREGREIIGCLIKGGTLLLLESGNDATAPVENSSADSPELQQLPVGILHGRVFPALLGIEPGSKAESGGVEYTSSASEIFWGVQSGRFDLGFLLPPIAPASVQNIARHGGRLPIKSTFFYPKIPSGLVVYPHSE